jgi:4-amino-4-deoxy-L-arabinose transferase-like glycosyltransferase
VNPLRWYFLALLVAAALGLFIDSAHAESVTVDQAKEILRLQYTEFCATVKMPPQGLITGVQAAAQAGNEDAQIAFMWLIRIIERYKQNGCGDA